MQKIHKERIPVPGIILVQGFSWIEANAKFVSLFGHSILKELTSLPHTFHSIRAEYEYVGLDNALNYIGEIRQLSGPPVLVEFDVEAFYPSIKHDTVHLAFLSSSSMSPNILPYSISMCGHEHCGSSITHISN